MGIRYLVGFMLTIIVLVKKIVDKNMVALIALLYAGIINMVIINRKIIEIEE